MRAGLCTLGVQPSQWSARGNRSRVSAVRTERNRGWVVLAAHERSFNVGAEAWMPHVVRRFAHVVAEPCATIVAALAGRSDAAVGAEAFTGAALPFHFLCIGGLASRDQSRGSVANRVCCCSQPQWATELETAGC